jgi:hypothetical protein
LLRPTASGHGRLADDVAGEHDALFRIGRAGRDHDHRNGIDHRPANAPAPLSDKQLTRGTRRTSGIPQLSTFLYITFSISQPVAATLLQGVTLAGAVSVTAQQEDLEVDDISRSTPTELFTDPGTPSGSSVTFAPTIATMQLVPGKIYLMQAVAEQGGVLLTTFVNNTGVSPHISPSSARTRAI